jgi:hypothetical protein
LPSTRTDRTHAWLSSCSAAERSRRARGWCCALVLAGALASFATSAGAESAAPLVIVVSSNPDAPFVRRLAAELSLFGYRVELATRGGSDGDLDQLLLRRSGAALIAVDQGGQTAEVIVGERAGAVPSRRERERLDPRRQVDTNAAVLAERFRARLTELGIAPAAVREGAQVAAQLPEIAPEPEPEPLRRLWLAAALGASSGGLGLMPDVQLELRAFPVAWLSTSAFGKWSPVPAHVSASAGAADVRLFSAGLLIDAYPVRGDVALKLGLGAMLLNASMVGHASAPWRGQDVSVLVPAGIFESAVAWPISRRVSLELRGFIGLCSPGVVVRLAGRRAADFGQPFLGASLGVAVGVF